MAEYLKSFITGNFAVNLTAIQASAKTSINEDMAPR